MGYLPDLKMVHGGTHRYKEGSIRDIIAKDPEYESTIDYLLTRQFQEDGKLSNGDVSRAVSDWLIQFPRPYSLQQRVYDLKEPLSDILKGHREEHTSKIAYEAIMLHSMCRNEEWRTRFVQRGGMDRLLSILFLLGSSYLMDIMSSLQSYELGVSYIASILYDICYGRNGNIECPRHVFLSKVLAMMQDYRYGHNMLQTDSDKNFLIYSICTNARLPSQRGFVFLDELPRNVVSLHSLPLIMGYCRECVSSHCVPIDIVNLLAYFF